LEEDLMTPEISPADPAVETDEADGEWDFEKFPAGPPMDYVVSEEMKRLIASKREALRELARNPPPEIDYFHNDD
jgi:hypothetical protein